MDILERIKKGVQGIHISNMTNSDIAKSTDWVKTPSLDLNRVLSGSLVKGLPNKNLIAIVGPEGTMKSSFIILTMAEAQRNGYTPVIIDTERGVDNAFCSRWGLNTDNVIYAYTPWVDKVKSILASIKDSGDKKLIIGIDSIGGLDRWKSFTDALGDNPKSDQGQLQKSIRSLLKLLLNICIEQESIGIVSGHLYGRPGMIPLPDQIGGGHAMRLFPSILINLKKKAIKEEGKTIGTEISASTLKNRIYPPFQTATVSIDYTKGINVYSGIIDLMLEAGLIEKSGVWYSYRGEKLGQGKTNAEIALEAFPGLIKKLDEWLKMTGYSNISEGIKEAEELFEQKEIKKPGPKVEKIDGKVIVKNERSGEIF